MILLVGGSVRPLSKESENASVRLRELNWGGLIYRVVGLVMEL